MTSLTRRTKAIILAIGVLANVVMLGDAEPAVACSRAFMFDEEGIGGATILARLEEISRRTERYEIPASEGSPVYTQELVIATVQVRETYRGTLPAQFDIYAGVPSSSCEIEKRFVADEVVSLYVPEAGPFANTGVYNAHYGRITVDEFIAATTPGPIDSKGPATTLVFGRRGGASVMALDNDGLAVAYGEGPGPVHALSVCPGGEHSVEIVTDPPFSVLTHLVLRRLSDLAVLRQEPLPRDETGGPIFGAWFSTLSCLDPAGETVVLTGKTLPFDHVDSSSAEPIAMIRRDGQLSSFPTLSMAATMPGRTGQVIGISADNQLMVLDATGTVQRQRAIGHPVEALAVSRDGQQVALAVPSATQPPEHLVYQLRRSVDAVLVGPVEGPWQRVAVTDGEFISLSAHLDTGFLVTTGRTTQLIGSDGSISLRWQWAGSEEDRLLGAHLTPGGTALAAAFTRRGPALLAPDAPRTERYGFEAQGFAAIGPALTAATPPPFPDDGPEAIADPASVASPPAASDPGSSSAEGAWGRLIPGTGGGRLPFLTLVAAAALVASGIRVVRRRARRVVSANSAG
ncbi:MAG: hypothetical protein ACKV2O_03770 [Acidimicrobiales bacterium]